MFGVFLMTGAAACIWGFASIAVIALDPVPGQHAVVGTAMPATAMLVGLVAWRSGSTARQAAGMALTLLVAVFVASALQAALGRAGLYGAGNDIAPLLLGAAFALASVTAWSPRSAYLPGAIGALVLVGAYVVGSLWWPPGRDNGGDAALLFGGTVVAWFPVLVAGAAGGWAEHRGRGTVNPRTGR